jgi:hypothetical protein
MTQRYKHPLARKRMSEGRCPECGQEQGVHTGGGGIGCSLTDHGVAERIYAFRQEEEEKKR